MLDLEFEYQQEIDAAQEAFEEVSQEEFDAIVLAEAWAYM